MPDQLRYTNVLTTIVTASAATSPPIPFHDYAGCHIQFPNTFTPSSLAIYVSSAVDGTYAKLVDVDATDVAIASVVNTVVDCPVAMFACHWVRFVANSGGGTMTLMFKS